MERWASAELEEVGAQLDDPDGVGAPKALCPGDGWELDAPMVAGPDDEPGEAAGA